MNRNRNPIVGRLTWPALILCGVLAAPAATASDQPKASVKTMTDKDITLAVQDALMFDSSVPGANIAIVNSMGVVTLTGSVDSLRAKDRAVAIARSVRGVRSVVDQIEVRPADRTDADILKDVNNALLLDPATESYEIDVSVSNGAVALTGSVQSWQEQQLAAEVAKGVRGVERVTNSLRINYKTNRADSEIQPEIERALENDVRVDASLIAVAVKDGQVTLTGTTGSAAESLSARSDAWVAGVKHVDSSGLSVEAWADRTPRQTDAAISSDEQIRRAVIDAFLYDPRVNSFNPTVTVNGGVVRLTGTVDNLKARQAAERDAENTVGVWRVKNYLTVEPTDIVADSKIVTSVQTAMLFNPLIDSSGVRVTSHGGLVTLTGAVDTYLEKAEVEDVAMRTRGVTAVANNVEVRNPSLTAYHWDYRPFYGPGPYVVSWPYESDAQITENIKDELFWSPFVDSDEVTVSVMRGVATLTGTVDSWAEYRAAGLNALEGGASSVINELVVG